MFDFFAIIFSKIITFTASIIIATGLVSIPPISEIPTESPVIQEVSEIQEVLEVQEVSVGQKTIQEESQFQEEVEEASAISELEPKPELEQQSEEELPTEEPIEEKAKQEVDVCDNITCSNCQYCSSGSCIDYCQGAGANCGCASCANCNDSDECSENNYLDYYCSGTDCAYNSDDCSDCSCSCGGYNTEENIENGNCEDGKDNDCNGLIDLEDSACFPSGTKAEGIISEDTIWTVQGSPYIIIDDILIEKDVTLTIKPGVTVNFKRGKGKSNFGGFEILNRGNIIAKGNLDNKIIFTSLDKLRSWGTIEIVSGGTIYFDNVEIEYASNGITAANASSVTIINSRFSNCGTGIFTAGPAIISNNIIENNHSGIIYCGIDYSARDDGSFSYFGIKKTEITYNTIRNNIGQGLVNSYHAGVVFQDLISSNFSLTLSYNDIYNNGSGIKSVNSSHLESLLIKNNNIYNHSDYNIWIGSQGSEIDASNNWWGTTNASVIDSKIYDYYDDYILSLPKVNYQPIATSEIIDAGIK
ncbi:right-handed parallel beta-helix repeat-containing protein [Patescibacteria group bacterium]|nr:right-handed parallel beta-helix repeat-containing protein [Patescibacteria group bacterium]